MSSPTRISLLAVLVLVIGLLGAAPAGAAPPGTITLASGTSGTAAALLPVARTAAGLVYRDAEAGLLIRSTGGTTTRETRMSYPTVMGDIVSDFNYTAQALTWRTIADPTLRTTAIPVGLTYLTRTATGYLASRGSGPFELLRVDLPNGTPTVFGTSPTAMYSVQAGPLGAVVPSSSAPTEKRYFPYSGSGAGQVLTVPSNASCTLTSTHLYCASHAEARLSRLPLTGAAGTDAAVGARGLVETSTGVAFLSYVGKTNDTSIFTLQTWSTANAAPTVRLDQDFGLLEGIASTADAPGTVLVARGGPVGQAGISAVAVAAGTPTQEVTAPAEPRVATQVAIGPGVVAWSDNQSLDGSIWARDLSTGSAPLTAGAPRLVASNATGATLSLSGDRLTYSVGRSRFGPTALNDGGAVQQFDGYGSVAALSGDRLLLRSFVNREYVWTLKDLRTGQTTTLPDAVHYDLWGERLTHLAPDGSVWVRNLRTGGQPVLLRAATAASSLYGTVHIAGDLVVWHIRMYDSASGISTTDAGARNVGSMAPATALPSLDNLYDVSTGYAVGSRCSDSCQLVAIRLADGQVTPIDLTSRRAAVDGNTVGFVSADRLPSVVALPAYTDQPRLLGTTAAPSTFVAGGTWAARVIASRVLSSCQVEIRSSTDALVRALDCTDPHAATTVTWDGKDTAGAVAPDGAYRWRLVGAVDGLPLVDYDGSTSGLSGTVAVSGSSAAPTVTARTPAANATGVAVAGNLTATFSEPVVGVSTTTFVVRNSAGTVIPAAVSYNATTRAATLNPTASLPPDARYTATLTGGSAAIRNAKGIALATQSWAFTTGPVPAVTARTPASNGTSVGVTANLTAKFSEAVQGVSTATFALRDAAGAVVPAAVSYNATTRVATLNPSANLPPDARFTATLTGGTAAIRDAAGNPLLTQSWAFTTGPAPTVTARTPGVNATAVLRSAHATATFSEPVQGVSVTTATLRNPAGAAVSATVAYNATTRVATIDPVATLAASTKYTVTLTGGATGIRDLAGNPLATLRWTFTTGAR